MRVTLAYGKDGLPVDFDAAVDVIEPAAAPVLPASAPSDALQSPIASPPLSDLVRPDARVTLVISDVTRPAPNRLLVEAVLHEISHVARERISILVATGLHRPCRTDELEAMLGAAILRDYRVINHDANADAELRELGTTSSGRPVIVNRVYLDADVRITVGLIEPHFFAGFSGGAKLILPGVAGATSIMRNHDAEMIGHPDARWGVRDGNPIMREQREAARLAGCEFSLNVLVNARRQITGVFAGALEPAHDAGCDAALQTVMQPVAEAYDVVVTTNGGYPLDLNLYQAVKGMDAAAQIVSADGDIIIAAECREGAGHGDFATMLHEHDDPASMLATIESPHDITPDQWQNQILARVLSRATVHIHASGLSDDEIRGAFCQPCADVANCVSELAASDARVCVLPRGPESIPYLKSA